MIEPAKIQVRITDVDILGHVNNAIYLTYFEIARVHYFTQLVGSDWDWLENGVVLVQNEVQYHLPVFLQDQPEIHIFCNKIGQKSFTLSYELYVKGELRTSGSSTLVGFNSKLCITFCSLSSFSLVRCRQNSPLKYPSLARQRGKNVPSIQLNFVTRAWHLMNKTIYIYCARITQRHTRVLV